jgi:uncharacterized protein (TIGR02611 family)
MATEEVERRGEDERADDDDTPELLINLRDRKERHKQRHVVHRAAVVTLGFVIVLAGIVMSGPGVPGPGIAVIIIGLGFLALEFDRAERVLERAIIWADRALAAAAFVVAAALWDIPLLPIV